MAATLANTGLVLDGHKLVAWGIRISPNKALIGNSDLSAWVGSEGRLAESITDNTGSNPDPVFMADEDIDPPLEVGVVVLHVGGFVTGAAVCDQRS